MSVLSREDNSVQHGSQRLSDVGSQYRLHLLLQVTLGVLQQCVCVRERDRDVCVCVCVCV